MLQCADLNVGVMLSIARSWLAIPIQFVFLTVNALALVLGVVYNHKTPELYENNSHSKIGWIMTWIASAWVFMALVQVYAGRTKAHPSALGVEAAQPMTAANMAHYQRVHDERLPDPARFSIDSGQGTERNTESLYSHSRSPSVESENQQFAGPMRRYAHDDDDFDDATEKRGFLINNSVDRFLSRYVARLRFVYVLIDRTILVQGWAAMASGAVVYGGIAVRGISLPASE